MALGSGEPMGHYFFVYVSPDARWYHPCGYTLDSQDQR